VQRVNLSHDASQCVLEDGRIDRSMDVAPILYTAFFSTICCSANQISRCAADKGITKLSLLGMIPYS